MKRDARPVKTLADVLRTIDGADLSVTQRRDLKSAVNRICQMAGQTTATFDVRPPAQREILAKILPAAHGISPKTFANIRSLFGAALELAGVIDRMGRASAKQDPVWSPFVDAIASDKRLACGLAAFANWCARNRVSPSQVNDETVGHFLEWLEKRTLCPKPRDVARRVPNVWNEAATTIDGWPKIELTRLSFKQRSERLSWDDLSMSFRADAEAYLEMRAKPDIFDDRPHAPKRPLAKATVHLQSEHLRLAASVLVESGFNVDEVSSVADLIELSAYKTILRHYHERANGRHNAFVTGIAKTLIQAAQHHVEASDEHIGILKTVAAKLPVVPFDLTEKNKELLRKLESKRLRAKLLFLPERLMREVTKGLEKGRFPFVKAQVAIAVDILLIAPLRPQNLARLNWGRHFCEPDGTKSKLVLHIAADETKTKKRELIFEIPPEVAKRLRWYRRHVLPRLNADPNGDLFVTASGRGKSQETLTDQLNKAIEQRVGIRMSPHKFRHFAAMLYLEAHPEDLETPRAFLGHAYAKTTLIYAGSSTRRASRAYNSFVLAQRETLKLKRPRK